MALDAAGLKKLVELKPELKQIVLDVEAHCDFTITCAYRDPAAQDAAFKAGTSQVPAGKSTHNTMPASGFDFAPIIKGKVVINDRELLCYLAGQFKHAGDRRGTPVRWGNDWNRNGDISEKVPGDRFDDLYHIELVPQTGA